MPTAKANYTQLVARNNESIERMLATTKTKDMVQFIVKAGKARKKRDIEFQIGLWHLWKHWQPLWDMKPPRKMRAADGSEITSWYAFRVWLASRVQESPNTLENYALRVDKMKSAGMEWPAIVNMLAIAPTHVDMLVNKQGTVLIDLPPETTLSEFVMEELSVLPNPHEVGERIRQETGAPTYRFHSPVYDTKDGGMYFTVSMGWTEKPNDGNGDRERVGDFKYKLVPVDAVSRDKRPLREIRNRLKVGRKSETELDAGL